jgi:hypothetical protein
VSFPAYLAVGVPPLPANVADLVSGVESDVVVEAVQWAARSLPVRPSMPILADQWSEARLLARVGLDLEA